jgi:hypothetical protein
MINGQPALPGRHPLMPIRQVSLYFSSSGFVLPFNRGKTTSLSITFMFPKQLFLAISYVNMGIYP